MPRAEVTTMTFADATTQQSLDIFIDELVSDEEFRDAFLRNPRKTLRGAAEWGLPLCESEIRSLIADRRLWDRVVNALNTRLQEAA
jgi:hypothetical protein